MSVPPELDAICMVGPNARWVHSNCGAVSTEPVENTMRRDSNGTISTARSIEGHVSSIGKSPTRCDVLHLYFKKETRTCTPNRNSAMPIVLVTSDGICCETALLTFARSQISRTRVHLGRRENHRKQQCVCHSQVLRA